MASSIAAVMSTSPTSGALRIVLGPSPSIAATMCLLTAFFDPRTEMSPRSGPDGSTSQVSVTQTTVGAWPARPGAIASARRRARVRTPILKVTVGELRSRPAHDRASLVRPGGERAARAWRRGSQPHAYAAGTAQRQGDGYVHGRHAPPDTARAGHPAVRRGRLPAADRPGGLRQVRGIGDGGQGRVQDREIPRPGLPAGQGGG